MILEIKKSVLMESLNHSIKGVSTKNIIPILNCIKLSLKEEGLYLFSTDNDLTINILIEKDKLEKIESLGEIVVSGKYLFEIVRKLSNDIIRLEELIDNKLSITTKNSSFVLNTNNVEDYPNISFEANKTPIILDINVFKNIIQKTAFATSTQESRPILTGINLKLFENVLEATATDSFRVAKITTEIDNKLEENIDITLPTKNILEILKIFDNYNDNIELNIFPNKIQINTKNIHIISTIINSTTYPDINSLIPNNYLLELSVNRVLFTEAIDRASLLTSELDKNTIKLETLNNKITISSNIPEIGKVEEFLEGRKNNSEDITISFSSKFMLDSLKTLESENITLYFSGEVKPIIIKEENNPRILHLIVPIRTY